VAFIVDGRISVIARPRDLKLRYGQAKVRAEFREPGSDAVAAREFPLPGLGENLDFLGLLRGGKVESLHSLEATLEDVFIKVTGRGLA
jgi:fluoroquinolone transport system ATP-binding protein